MENISNASVLQLVDPSIEVKYSNLNFRKEKTNINNSNSFTELVEKDLFNPSNCNKIKENTTTEERKALKTMQDKKLRSHRL